MFARYGKKDWLIAGVLVLVMLFVAGMQLTLGVPYWGDDFAAYLSEGIAISEGTLAEQAALNPSMHPSPMPQEAREGSLVYAWGYPLVLSAVHRLAGFDRADYSSVVYYKLPSLLAFGLLAGVLYLFYRRRFSVKVSVFLTLLLCACGTIIEVIDRLYLDTFFLFFCMLSFWLAECLAEAAAKQGRKIGAAVGAVVLGIAFWMTCEIRLNGMTVIGMIGFFHGLWVIRKWKDYRFAGVALLLVPYVVFLSCKVVSESLLMPVTSNMSDVGSVTCKGIMQNAGYYIGCTFLYFFRLSSPVSYVLGPLMLLLMLAGMAVQGFRWENVYLTIFIVATYVVLVLLPYVQGLRYMFNLLPFLLMYAAYGGRWLYGKWQQRKPLKNGKKILAGMAAAMLVCSYGALIISGAGNLINGRQPEKGDVYSPEAIETYQFIRQHTREDATIAFIKPRALHLNTGRQAIRPGVNGHQVTDADYLLHIKVDTGDAVKAEEMLLYAAEAQAIVFENEAFTLYKMK